MKLSARPSRIVGIRTGEISFNNLGPGGALQAKFQLLGDPKTGDQLHLGAYTKTQWSKRAIEALETFLEVLEEEAMVDVFGGDGGAVVQSTDAPLSFPQVPVLGGPKNNNPP